MPLRERLGYFILIRHIEDSYWIPFEDNSHIGTGYFKIDYRWYNFIKFISGLKPEKLINKYAHYSHSEHKICFKNYLKKENNL